MSRLPALGPRGEGWVAIQFVLFVAIAITGVTLTATWSEPWASAAKASGLLLVALGAILAGAGLVGLRDGDALTAVPRPRDEARLVEAGAYRLVRHPIYGGLVLAAVGWALMRASIPALLAAALLFLFFDMKRRREEVWLAERFPGYSDYRKHTRVLIPFLY
jgi:protein-S-isoprenylcysteine O-methyltransferase Ste14